MHKTQEIKGWSEVQTGSLVDQADGFDESQWSR